VVIVPGSREVALLTRREFVWCGALAPFAWREALGQGAPAVSARGLAVHRRAFVFDAHVHALDRDEVAGLRKLQQTSDSPFVFVSERGGVLSADMVARIVQRAAQHACIGFHVHPHMLRHSAGHMLANEGTDTRLIQDFLGHRDIRNTVRYTQLSVARLRSVRVR